MSRSRQPRLIPVIDVLGGEVVRAIAGQREQYRPIVSRITTSTHPVDVARELLRAASATELYVADLDAIHRHHTAPSPVVQELFASIAVPIWFDSGIRQRSDLTDLPPHVRPVIGTETLEDPEVISILNGSGSRVAISVDLLAGQLLGDWKLWGIESAQDVLGLVAILVSKKFQSLILLDLAAVGVGQGPQTLRLCCQIRKQFPHLEILTGGGVRSEADVRQLGEAGADGVLVASALHDGQFTRN